MRTRRSIVALILALNITFLNSNIVYSAPKFKTINNKKLDINIENVDNIYKNIIIDKEIAYFDNKEVDYSYIENYISKQEVNKMINNLKYHEKYKERNELSASEIVADIAINSNKGEYNEYTSIFKTPDSFGFQVILNMIIEDLINNETNDIDEDLSIIKDLKILSVPYEFTEQYLDIETRGIYYDESANTIFVHRESLFENNEELKSKEYYYTLSKNLIHLINDIRQIGVNSPNYLRYLNIYTPLFLEDASTRYPEIFKKYDIEDNFSYITNKDQKLILLLSLFSKSKPKEFYNAIFDEDAKKVFEILNLNTNDDIYDFYKVMYAVDASSYKNDFFLQYQSYQESKDHTLYQAIGYSYKETIYNHYVSNLLNYLKDNDMSLEENLTMYYLALDLIGSNIDKNSNNYNNLKSLDSIRLSHNHYIEFIMNYYNVTLDDINSILKDEVLKNILSLQKTYGLNMKDVSSYLNKFPMLKIYSNSVINVEGYQSIIDYEKILKKDI